MDLENSSKADVRPSPQSPPNRARNTMGAWALGMLLAASAASGETGLVPWTASDLPSLSGFSGEAVFEASTYSTTAGQPKLPVVVKSFLLPADAELRSVRARWVETDEQPVEGQWDVKPVPPMFLKEGTPQWPRGRMIHGGKDLGIYQTDAFFPDSDKLDIRVSQQGDLKFVDCQVVPYRYNPVTRQLSKVVSGVVEITYERVGEAKKSRLAKPPKGRKGLDRDLRRLRKRFVNEVDLEPFYAPAAEGAVSGTTSSVRSIGTSALATSAAAAPGGYAIVTTSATRTSLSSVGMAGLSAFVALKQSQGFTVHFATEAQWGGGVGDNAANGIRQWLQANRTNLNLQYVLLIGNPDPVTGDVPMKGAFPDGSSLVPTDFFYAELSGDWDANGNGVAGESDDFTLPGGPDAFAEVSVGRIPVYTNLAETDKILLRTVTYQNTTATKALDRRMVLLPMVPLDPATPSYQLGEQIRTDFVVPSGWRQHRIYDTTVNDNGILRPIPGVKSIVPAVEMLDVTPANVVKAWNTVAQGLTIWMTHGSGTGAAEIMEHEHTRLLSDNTPGIVLHGSCSNAEPEVPQNLAYTLLKSGAIATIAGTRVTWYTPGATDFRDGNSDGSIAYQFARHVIQDGLPVSDAFNAVRSGIAIANWWNWIAFNTYGAPEITLNTTYAGPKFDISRDIVEFGDFTSLDPLQTQTVVLENSGTTSMTVQSVVSDNAAFTTSGVSAPLVLTAGQKVTLSVRFNPATVGHFSGKVTVRTSLGDKVIRVRAASLPSGEFLHLTDFNWGSDLLNGFYPWRRDLGTEGFPIVFDMRPYSRGIGGHSADGAESYVTYDLRTVGRKIQSFFAEVGVDDRLGDPSCGSVVFKVYLDGVLAQASPYLDTDAERFFLHVPVGSASILKLALNDGGNGGCGDHGDWGNTRLYTAPNQAPITALTTPTANQEFASGATVALVATASDIDGTIAKVEFFRGTTKIGEDLSSPYQVSWTNAVQGTWSLTSRATDNLGASTTSAPVSIVVKAPVVVKPAAPTGLSATAGNAQVALTWNAATGASSYSVKRATVAGGPYTVVATGLTATSHTNTGLVNGTRYHFVVTATNSAGEGPGSAEVSAIPAAPVSSVKARYKAATTSASSNQLRPHLALVNGGTTPIPLTELKVRYWYTADGTQAQQFNIDWAAIGGSKITGTFVRLAAARPGADAYVELGFTAAAGSLAAGASTGEIQARVNKSDWSNYTQTGDHSFDPTKTAYADWSKVTVYRNGVLIWGTEP